MGTDVSLGWRLFARNEMLTRRVIRWSKNRDLSALTAVTIARSQMGVKSLNNLRRFTAWDLKFDSDSMDETTQWIHDLISHTFYLVNPNKDHVAIETIPPDRRPKGGDWIRVVSIDGSNAPWPGVARMGIPLVSVEFSTLWWIDWDGSDPRQAIEDQLIVTQSHTHGLLVNPIFEKFQWIPQ